jgi:hypothetical protein
LLLLFFLDIYARLCEGLVEKIIFFYNDETVLRARKRYHGFRGKSTPSCLWHFILLFRLENFQDYYLYGLIP